MVISCVQAKIKVMGKRSHGFHTEKANSRTWLNSGREKLQENGGRLQGQLHGMCFGKSDVPFGEIMFHSACLKQKCTTGIHRS